jgi:hypothetical protein
MSHNPSASRFLSRALAAVCLVCLVAVAGCGKKTVSVNGTVKHNTKPVTAGQLMFSPVVKGSNEPGKPAVGVIKSDGTFSLQTGTDTGAAPGTYKVTFSPPPGEQSKIPGKDNPPPPYLGLEPKQEEVEIKDGSNIEIELVPAKKKKP